MPEGDTIHKLAAALRPLLEDAPLAAVATRSQRGAPLVEHGPMRARRVTARGKHLLLDLDAADDRGWQLRTHLGMYGTWHQYPLAGAWHKPRGQAGAVLTLQDRVLVCFHPRELQWRPRRECSPDVPRLDARVGPDLLDPELDLAALVSRVRSRCRPGRPILDVLLDQALAAGVGNVYKSEVLFLHGCHPLTPLERLDDARLRALYADAARLLRRNLRAGPRITRARAAQGAYLYVYRRGGTPCRECGTPIEYARLGEHRRSTWWCPACQPAEPATGRTRPNGQGRATPPRSASFDHGGP